jgi:hypothetical protein
LAGQDLDAVYFVAPTPQNVQHICEDCSAETHTVQVIFAGKPAAALLTKLLASCGGVDAVCCGMLPGPSHKDYDMPTQVAWHISRLRCDSLQVEDMRLGFEALGDRAFDLGLRQSALVDTPHHHHHHLLAEKLFQVCTQLAIDTPAVRWYDAREIGGPTERGVHAAAAAATRVAASHSCCRVAELLSHKLADAAHERASAADARADALAELEESEAALQSEKKQMKAATAAEKGRLARRNDSSGEAVSRLSDAVPSNLTECMLGLRGGSRDGCAGAGQVERSHPRDRAPAGRRGPPRRCPGRVRSHCRFRK